MDVLVQRDVSDVETSTASNGVTIEEILGEIEIEICGRTYTFGRCLETLEAIEETVGAAAPFGRRLESGECKPLEVVMLFDKLLRLVPKAPTRRQVGHWIDEVGTAHPRLGLWIFALTIGESQLRILADAPSSVSVREPARTDAPG